MGRRLRSAALALPLLALAAGAGCGADEASAAEIVRGAAATTVEANTARMSFEVSLPEAAGAGTMTGEGAMDFEHQIGTMSFDLGPVLEASGERLPAGTDTEIEVVFAGTTYYMRFPMLAQAFGGEATGGKEWIKIDGAEAAADLGIDLREIEQMGNDPRQQLAYLTGVSDDIEEVGEEDVRGEATTHYRGTVLIEDVIAHLEDEQDAIVDVERFREQAEAAGLDEMDFDVWIDDEGRARRMVMAVPVPPGAGAGSGDGEVEVAMEMFDFGTEVDVAPPADDQVIDITELATQGG